MADAIKMMDIDEYSIPVINPERKIRLNTKNNGIFNTSDKYYKRVQKKLNKAVAKSEKLDKKKEDILNNIVIKPYEGNIFMREIHAPKPIRMGVEKIKNVAKKARSLFFKAVQKIHNKVAEKLEKYGYTTSFADSVENVVAKRDPDMAETANIVANSDVKDERDAIKNDVVSEVEQVVNKAETEEFERLKPAPGVDPLRGFDPEQAKNEEEHHMSLDDFIASANKKSEEEHKKDEKVEQQKEEKKEEVKTEMSKPEPEETRMVVYDNILERLANAPKEEKFEQAISFETPDKPDLKVEKKEVKSENESVDDLDAEIELDAQMEQLRKQYEEELEKAKEQREINEEVRKANAKKQTQKEKINNSIKALEAETRSVKKDYINRYKEAIEQAKARTASIQEEGAKLSAEGEKLSGEIAELSSQQSIAASINEAAKAQFAELEKMLSASNPISNEAEHSIKK